MKLGLIGIKKDIDITIREKFSILTSKKDEIIKKILEYANEVVILNTCNRTEIYLNHDLKEEEIIRKVFSILGWKENLKEYIFYKENDETIKHIFEVSCGYHSKITGEDQILGQVRDAYMYSLKLKASNKVLGRLFQDAVACGKKFRCELKLYEIPVSSISIVVNKFAEENCRKVMVLGYGEMGRLAVKYLLQGNFSEIYLVLRDIKKAADIKDNRVKVMTFNEKSKYINDVDGIIGCTSAPHAIVRKEEIQEEGKKLYCFDMAVPRDIEEAVLNLDRVESYNIDEISLIDDKNKRLRVERMQRNKWIIDDGINQYKEWLKIREISPMIKEIKDSSETVYKKRIKTYENKMKNSSDLELARMLIKSTSDYYLHRAIELLKEEKLKGMGCEEECIKVLNRIFIKSE